MEIYAEVAAAGSGDATQRGKPPSTRIRPDEALTRAGSARADAPSRYPSGPMSDCRILVADELTPEALEILSTAGQVVQKKGLKPADLARELPPFHALVVRSATQVDAEGLGGARSSS